MQRNDHHNVELIDLGPVSELTKGGFAGFEDNAGSEQLEPGLSDD